jgi:NADPH-dependent curcumin reductase CurA
MSNRMVKLARRPKGMVQRADFAIEDGAVPEPGPGQFRVKIEYISLDPAMRGWMNEARSYVPPVALGEVMRAGAAGIVEASNHPGFKPGDGVNGLFGVQTYASSKGDRVIKVDTSLAPLQRWIGGFGMPGWTAYFGLLEVGQPKAGETVVVSAAAGAVGSVVGQIAKIKGCRAIGIAGGPEKCAMVVDELGFDAAIDYRDEDVKKALRRHAPDGIDIYFDNVGGEILDAALANLAMRARVVICGAISQYQAGRVQGPSNYMSLLVKRARMEGFLVFDYAARYREAAAELATWIGDGRLKVKEHVVRGTIDDFPATLQMLFRGENVGKLVLELEGPWT